jgi:hypothetical protein
MIIQAQAVEINRPALIVLFNSAEVARSRPFGRGLLRSLPTYRVDYTADDDAWWGIMPV